MCAQARRGLVSRPRGPSLRNCVVRKVSGFRYSGGQARLVPRQCRNSLVQYLPGATLETCGADLPERGSRPSRWGMPGPTRGIYPRSCSRGRDLLSPYEDGAIDADLERARRAELRCERIAQAITCQHHAPRPGRCWTGRLARRCLRLCPTRLGARSGGDACGASSRMRRTSLRRRQQLEPGQHGISPDDAAMARRPPDSAPFSAADAWALDPAVPGTTRQSRAG